MSASSAPRFNLVTPTLGGLQLWTDELFFHGWHIQRHSFTGHCRLLDERNCRHAWGSFEACQRRLDEIRRQRGLPAMQGKVVIVLHGLIRTFGSMRKLCRYLHEHGGYTAINMSYPSTRADAAHHARALKSVIDHLKGVERIDLVSHSLGSIVIRHYFGDSVPCDPRIGRIVMYAPPNQGAELAEKLGRIRAFQLLFGPAGMQLARQWPKLQEHLAIPPCEFGIIAGGRGDERGWNPLLSGDDDGVVSVASTRLAGAADFLVLPVSHTLLMRNRQVLEYTLRFLEHGWFLSPEKRQPIPRPANARYSEGGEEAVSSEMANTRGRST
jgi:hypothetical protein